MEIADNKGNIISPLVVKPVNMHDTKLFDESFTKLLEIADLADLYLKESFLTLDPGFDSLANKNIIEQAGMIPVIKPNRRGTKSREKIYQALDEFELLEDVYKERYKMERCFAWEDTYRKLVIRYERLQEVHMGFKYLAYSLINFRWFFGKK